jgi:hypothetical protein
MLADHLEDLKTYVQLINPDAEVLENSVIQAADA